MQEEVTQRTVALCVEATKFSAGMLQQATKKVLDEMQKGGFIMASMKCHSSDSQTNSPYKLV